MVLPGRSNRLRAKAGTKGQGSTAQGLTRVLPWSYPVLPWVSIFIATRTIAESSKAAVHPAQALRYGKIFSFAKLDFFPNPPRPYSRRPSSSTPLAVSKRIRPPSSFQCFFSAPSPLTGNGQRPRTRHLSWSVNIFYNFIHSFIHSFGGRQRGRLRRARRAAALSQSIASRKTITSFAKA